MAPILKTIISLSRDALESEDRYLREAIGGNPAYQEDKRGSLKGSRATAVPANFEALNMAAKTLIAAKSR